MKNIIFDIDGTLWDTTEVVAKAWNKAVEEVGGTAEIITSSVLKKEFGKTMEVIADDLFHDNSERKRKMIIERCFQNQMDILKKDTNKLFFPHVEETIKKLSEKCNLFIVSNCYSAYIELFMEKAGIKKYITDYECSGNTGKNKGENIMLIIERNNLDDVVYVGDTQGDYEATAFAGIPFVFAKYGFGNVQNCNLVISDIKESLSLC